MIGYIEGTIISKDERGIIVLTQGIGYLVSISRGTFEHVELDTQAALWIHTVVREDVFDLYGFTTQEELRFFKLLTNISGIGPKSALNILSLADLQTIIHAIGSGDAGYLTKVSGIGKKNAEKIVLELKDKLETFTLQSASKSGTSIETEALEALEALGYDMRKTRELVRSLARDHNTTEEIIRAALKEVGKNFN
jgi:Holliday junction DNA helicase RuvA